MLDYLQKKPTTHLWYRVDEGDQDVASFFHHIGNLLPARAASELPVFGPEYADQPAEFARRFFRMFFRKLSRVGLLVIDDLHYGVETAQFRTMLAIMLRELPEDLQCACISRTLPPDELAELTFKGQLTALDQSILQFSDTEARALVASRSRSRSSAVDISAARGWAAGLVLLADRAAAGDLRAEVPRPSDSRTGRNRGVRRSRPSAPRCTHGGRAGGDAQGQPAARDHAGSRQGSDWIGGCAHPARTTASASAAGHSRRERSRRLSPARSAARLPPEPARAALRNRASWQACASRPRRCCTPPDIPMRRSSSRCKHNRGRSHAA